MDETKKYKTTYKVALSTTEQQELYQKWVATKNDHYRIKIAISYVSLISKLCEELKIVESKDLISIIVTKIYNQIPKYNAERASIYTYLYRVVRTKLIDGYRKQKRYTDHYQPIEAEHLEYHNNRIQNDISYADQEHYDLINLGVTRLKGIYRKVIIYRYYHNMKISKILIEMGITKSQYNHIMKAALLKLSRKKPIKRARG